MRILNMVVIFNSSPLINLSKLGKLGIIEKLFENVIVPRAVYNEIIVNGSGKEWQSDLENLFKLKIINIVDVKDKNLVKALRLEIDYGESEVIALALETNADLIILDEVDARKVAEMYDLKKNGFIGLLIKAKNKGIIEENLKDIIDESIKKGFWINKKLYNKIIKHLE